MIDITWYKFNVFRLTWGSQQAIEEGRKRTLTVDVVSTVDGVLEITEDGIKNEKISSLATLQWAKCHIQTSWRPQQISRNSKNH